MNTRLTLLYISFSIVALPCELKGWFIFHSATITKRRRYGRRILNEEKVEDVQDRLFKPHFLQRRSEDFTFVLSEPNLVYSREANRIFRYEKAPRNRKGLRPFISVSHK